MGDGPKRATRTSRPCARTARTGTSATRIARLRLSSTQTAVAANASLNRRRSLGRRRAREEALAHRQDAGDDLPSTPRDPEDAASGGEIQQRVQTALLGLPRDLRMAVVLYDIEGQSYGEIAQVLRIPEGTVKSRIHRARTALRDRLKAFAHAEDEGVEP